MKKRIILMGASGSIGKQIIEVIREHLDAIELVGVTVGDNVDFLEEILKEFNVKYAFSKEENIHLKELFKDVKFYHGEQDLVEMAKLSDYDMLVNSLVGFVGFKPTLAAIKNHKDIALANKETLVAGGKIITEALKENHSTLYPIDSEHVAIWQCMRGHLHKDIRRLIITGSGGAFRDLKRSELKTKATLQKALNHPTWNMGAKITIDSATMMNKGFEVIEAHYLFDIPYDKIDVILHSSSTVHSFVEYNDGSILAELGTADMRMMIKYALLAPRHLQDNVTSYLDLDTLTSLNFKKMDYDRYPLVKLAKQVGQYEGNFGAVLLGANDAAVDLFLKGRIDFVDIEKYIFMALSKAHYIKDPSVDDIIASQRWAKEFVSTTWANT